MGLLKGIPISEDQCMGDSLPIINDALSSVDVNLTSVIDSLTDVVDQIPGLALKTDLDSYIKIPESSTNGQSLIFNAGTGIWESKSAFPVTASPFHVLTYNNTTGTWVASAAPVAVGRDIHGVVFDGNVAACTPFIGNFSRGSSNTTININGHGLSTNHKIYLTFGSTLTNGDYVITVLDENNFTINVTGAAALGSVSFKMCKLWSSTVGVLGINYCNTGSYIALLTQPKALNSVIAVSPSGRSSSGSVAAGILPVLDLLGPSVSCERTANSFAFTTVNGSNVAGDAGERTSISLISY